MMRLLHSRWVGRGPILPGLLTATLLGCPREDPYRVKTDSYQILEKINDFVDKGPEGAAMRLDAATDFEWDTVYAFSGLDSAEYMFEIVGREFELYEEVLMRIDSDSKLLLFAHQGHIVHQMTVGGSPTGRIGPGEVYLWLSNPRRPPFSRERAVIEVESKDPGPYSRFRFREQVPVP